MGVLKVDRFWLKFLDDQYQHSLSQNNIGSEGTKALAKALEDSQKLTQL